ncbi:MAG: hypothetical protein NT159_22475 [Proteobacteria bacterium]|nr:hypothetical protein [Pseudomonadota bacterium]
MLDQAALAALNHLLLGASWARARLAPFAGRAARLSLPPFRLEFLISCDGLLTASESASDSCDVEISLPVNTPLLAMRGYEAVAKATRISGSAEFADALGFVLRNLSWDFEEDLSGAVGDIAAHRVAGLIKAFGAWHQQATRKLAENFAEYLSEEQPVLVNKNELGVFSEAVSQLGDDLAQIDLRIRRLGA